MYQHWSGYNYNKSNKRTQKCKNEKTCYTCHPRSYHKRFEIKETDNAKFLFDVAKRPMIIVTTKKHYNNINDVPTEVLQQVLKDMKEFCDYRNIRDYSISINSGKWQTHDHFHIKMRTYERQIKIMRDDHFKYLKLKSVFEQDSTQQPVENVIN